MEEESVYDNRFQTSNPNGRIPPHLAYLETGVTTETHGEFGYPKIESRGTTSASSSFKFWVERLQFFAGIGNAELPVHAALLGVCRDRPRVGLFLELLEFAKAMTVQALNASSWFATKAS